MRDCDAHHIRAAEGWLELDEAVEAARELEELSPAIRAHPAALLLHCQIYLATHRPDYTHVIATTLTSQIPDSPDAWFYLACAAARLHRNDDASIALKECFGAAIKTGQEDEWQKRVLATRDLDSFWCEQQLET